MSDIPVYAKLLSKYSVKKLYQSPFQSAPEPIGLKEYADANGYKVLVEKDNPGEMYSRTYEETETEILEIWTACSLEDAKKRKKDKIQEQLTAKLSERCEIPCALGYNIIFDNEAKFNAIGMSMMGSYSNFIDAADQVHELDAEGVKAVVAAIFAHQESLYAEATALRAQVDACTTVDEVQDVFIPDVHP